MSGARHWEQDKDSTLYIGNLDERCSDALVWELMLQAGIPLEEVLTAATLHGWDACGGAWCGRKFGWIEEGCAADIVALGTDPRVDAGALRNVQFVMKDGKVYKQNGLPVGMV